MLGKLDLRAITREKVKALAMAGLRKGQSPKTVQNIIRCLSSLFSHAVEDNLVAVNPALKPGKFLPKISKRRKIDPLTREEVAVLLETAKSETASILSPLPLCRTHRTTHGRTAGAPVAGRGLAGTIYRGPAKLYPLATDYAQRAERVDVSICLGS